VALSMMVFHDAVTLLNVSGLLLAILGAVWYRQYKQKPSSSLSTSLSSGVLGTGDESSSRGGGLRTPTAESGIFERSGDSPEEEEEEEGGDRAEGRAGEEEVEVEMYNISRAQLA